MDQDVMNAKSDAAAIIGAIEAMGDHRIVSEVGEDVVKLLVPKGKTIVDLTAEIDKRATFPRRATGTVNVDTLDSFLAIVGRHAGIATVVYVHDCDAPSIVAVLNDTAPECAPGWRDFRVSYTPKLSDEWNAWQAQDGETMSQGLFAEHLEDRCLDVISLDLAGPKTQGIVGQLGVRCATPATLQGLAKGLSVRVDSSVKEVRRLDSGECQVLYNEEHKGEDGKPLSIPNAFVIAIPVFVGGDAYAHVVRLRYRLSGGRVSWAYSVVHADTARRDAVLDMATKIRAALPSVLCIEGVA